MPVDEAVDLDQVLGVTRQLVELVRGTGLARLSVHAGTVRWEIEGTAPGPAGVLAPSGPAPQVAVNGTPVPVNGLSAVVPVEPPGHGVLAPLVGVFYRSATPGGTPFVEVGQQVRAGQQVAIVEAMKMLNEVVADRAGVLREIHVADAEIVEFGQRLFTIEPA